MKDQLYIIKTRYEYRGPDGIDWTNWFVFTRESFTKKDADELIKATKKQYADIDKKTHLKHEYMIVPVEEFEKECLEIQHQINEAQVRDEQYYASDKWKELKHKKYVSRKELKKHQEEYKKMMEELKNE